MTVSDTGRIFNLVKSRHEPTNLITEIAMSIQVTFTTEQFENNAAAILAILKGEAPAVATATKTVAKEEDQAPAKKPAVRKAAAKPAVKPVAVAPKVVPAVTPADVLKNIAGTNS